MSKVENLSEGVPYIMTEAQLKAYIEANLPRWIEELKTDKKTVEKVVVPTDSGEQIPDFMTKEELDEYIKIYLPKWIREIETMNDPPGRLKDPQDFPEPGEFTEKTPMDF